MQVNEFGGFWLRPSTHNPNTTRFFMKSKYSTAIQLLIVLSRFRDWIQFEWKSSFTDWKLHWHCASCCSELMQIYGQSMVVTGMMIQKSKLTKYETNSRLGKMQTDSEMETVLIWNYRNQIASFMFLIIDDCNECSHRFNIDKKTLHSCREREAFFVGSSRSSWHAWSSLSEKAFIHDCFCSMLPRGTPFSIQSRGEVDQRGRREESWPLNFIISFKSRKPNQMWEDGSRPLFNNQHERILQLLSWHM
jgi:hypothetical protein